MRAAGSRANEADSHTHSYAESSQTDSYAHSEHTWVKWMHTSAKNKKKSLFAFPETLAGAGRGYGKTGRDPTDPSFTKEHQPRSGLS